VTYLNAVTHTTEVILFHSFGFIAACCMLQLAEKDLQFWKE